MPDVMASHWGYNGEVNGHMPKLGALFLMPIISLIMYLFFVFIPKIDPLKDNIRKFSEYYNWFIIVLLAFLFYLHTLTIAVNLGVDINMNQAFIPAFAFLFFYVGILLEKAKRNWFIGIRTPWTLSSDVVWDKTHVLGGKLFKIAAFISVIGLVMPEYAMLFVLVPVLAAAIVSFAYSYFEYNKEVARLSKK